VLICDALQHPYLRGEQLAGSLQFRAAKAAIRQSFELAA